MGIYYTKLFFEIYYTITQPESTRGERSLDQFKIQLIAQLRNIGHKISVIDETSHIYQLNGKFILFFSPSDENPSESNHFLFSFLLKSDPPWIIK